MIRLGYEVGAGRPIEIPVRHLAVTGQTQLSGKTTTLEALIARSGLRAVAFVTKRAEGSFTTGRPLRPYFRERADWQFVSAVLEATLRERLKFERSWIMRACKGARTLADVQRNVRAAQPKAKGLSADVYMTLDEYLNLVIPQVERLPYTQTLTLAPGLNVMDLAAYTMELQALVIRSVLEAIYEHERETVVLIPEAWEFIPQARSSPVLLAAEQLIRKGGAAHNYVWLDSQDIASVHKNILRSVGVWIVGVQREANEVKRALAHIPAGVARPTVADIMHLEQGQFFACFGASTAKVYVQPAWMSASTAQDIARGRIPIDRVIAERSAQVAVDNALTKEDAVTEAEARRLRDENDTLTHRIQELERQIEKLTAPPARPQRARPPASGSLPASAPAAAPMNADDEIVYQRFKARLLGEAQTDPALLRVLTIRPELEVEVKRQTVTADGTGALGMTARLIAEGFFDNTVSGHAAWKEAQRRGFGGVAARIYEVCTSLCGKGFLFKEANGYRAVPGMKVNIVDR